MMVISLRRSSRSPNILIPIFLAILGAFIIIRRIDFLEEAVIEYEDPFDFEIPQSSGRCFESVNDDGSPFLGLPFPQESFVKVKFLENIKEGKITTFMNEEVVFVMYSSWEHFLEAKEGIRQLRTITNNTIIFYNLGLHKEQTKELGSVCNLKVIDYPFEEWPRYGKWLLYYTFKPIIWAEMYKTYNAFWVIDASVRFYNLRELELFYDRVRLGDEEPITFDHPTEHSIGAATHTDMFSHLPLSRERRKTAGMWKTGTIFIVRSKLAKEIIKWTLICALTKECFAPVGANSACKANTNCSHRFDQSAASIIRCALRLRNNLPCLSLNSTEAVFTRLAKISTETRYDGPLPTC